MKKKLFLIAAMAATAFMCMDTTAMAATPNYPLGVQVSPVPIVIAGQRTATVASVSGANVSSATEQNTSSGQDCSALWQNQSAEDDCYFQRALNENNHGECYNIADMTKVTKCLNKFK